MFYTSANWLVLQFQSFLNHTQALTDSTNSNLLMSPNYSSSTPDKLVLRAFTITTDMSARPQTDTLILQFTLQSSIHSHLLTETGEVCGWQLILSSSSVSASEMERPSSNSRIFYSQIIIYDSFGFGWSPSEWHLVYHFSFTLSVIGSTLTHGS